jgi:hypothetical protein
MPRIGLVGMTLQVDDGIENDSIQTSGEDGRQDRYCSVRAGK